MSCLVVALSLNKGNRLCTKRMWLIDLGVANWVYNMSPVHKCRVSVWFHAYSWQTFVSRSKINKRCKMCFRRKTCLHFYWRAGGGVLVSILLPRSVMVTARLSSTPPSLSQILCNDVIQWADHVVACLPVSDGHCSLAADVWAELPLPLPPVWGVWGVWGTEIAAESFSTCQGVFGKSLLTCALIQPQPHDDCCITSRL